MIKRFIKSALSKRHSSPDIVASEMHSSLSRISSQGFNPSTIIDVGVGKGTQDLYRAFPSASLFLIDPLIEFEDIIKSILSKRNGGYAIAAAGESNKTQTLNVHEKHLEGSSLFNECTPSIDDGQQREIPVVTLDGIVLNNRLKGPFLIKVDAQGYEIEVIKGSLAVLPNTEVIILEVLLYKFLTTNPIFHDVVSYMNDLGFVCYDIFGLSYRPKDNALAHLDIVFAKNNGLLRTSDNWE